jgi:hypothetical protein
MFPPVVDYDIVLSAVCPITQQEDIPPSCVRIMLRDGMTQEGFM